MKPPPYKHLDIKTEQHVSLKFFVPFENQAERDRLLRTRSNANGETANDSGDEEDEVMMNEMEMSQTIPDGKYESEVLAFKYIPAGIPVKRKNDNMQYFEPPEHNDRDRDGNFTNLGFQ